jgi:hypothetical protein
MKRKIFTRTYQSSSAIPHKLITFALIVTISIGGRDLTAKMASKLYSMADLRVLASQNSPREFLENARSILPSERNKEWKRLTRQMGRALIVGQVKNESFTRANHHFIESLTAWPILRQDEFFQIRRQQFNLNYFLRCSATVECLKELTSFWNNSRGTLHLAHYVELGIKLAEHFKGVISTKDEWKLLAPAAQSELSNFHCQKKSVKKAVLVQIERLFNRHGRLDGNPVGKKLTIIANSLCLQQIAIYLKSELPSLTANQKDLAYRLLTSNALLNTSERDLLLITYLLENPLIGDTFNEAWNVMEELGLNFKRRQKLFNRLKMVDPLPGKIFSSPDLRKRKVITRLIYQNFPEYLDHYSKQCLNYFEGKLSYPNGNPTVECRDLITTSKNTRWINQRVRQKIEKIIK